MTSENTEHRAKSDMAAPRSGKDSAPDGSRPGAGGGRDAVLVGCALAAQSLHGWLTNGSVFASVIPYFPLARDLNMAFSVVAFALVALAAFYRPRLLDLGQMALVSAGCLFSATLIVPLAAQAQSAPFATLGLFLYSMGCIWPAAMALFALASLATSRLRSIVAATGLLAGALLSFFLPTPSALVGLIAALVLKVGTMAILWRLVRPALSMVTSGPPASQLKPEAPDAFIPLFHPLMICILLFAMAGSYGSVLSEYAGTAPVDLSIVAAGGALLWLIFSRRGRRADDLFSLSVILVIGGFLLIPLGIADARPWASSLLAAGGACFSILRWLTLSSIGSRNIFALVPTFAFADIMTSLGTEAGAAAAHASMAVWGQDATGAIATGGTFILVVFLWLGFRSFSFTETIRGVEPIRPLPSSEAGASLADRCDQLAEATGLTGREREIFLMLAKGRNTRFIQEQLVISPNTVRSHIKHLYVKLDVHSQQELIDLVER